MAPSYPVCAPVFEAHGAMRLELWSRRTYACRTITKYIGERRARWPVYYLIGPVFNRMAPFPHCIFGQRSNLKKGNATLSHME